MVTAMGTLLHFPPPVSCETLDVNGALVTIRVWFNHQRPREAVDFGVNVSEDGAVADLFQLLDMISGPCLGPRLTPGEFRRMLSNVVQP